MHAIEKILAKNSGRTEVKTGEIITAKVDFAEINDLYLQTVYSFYEMGGEKVWDPERCAFVFDHYAPTPDVKSASNHKEMREFAQKNGLRFHFDTNCGVCHQVMPEAGVIYPGMIVVATDSHTTTHGAFGAMPDRKRSAENRTADKGGRRRSDSSSHFLLSYCASYYSSFIEPRQAGCLHIKKRAIRKG